MLLYTHSSLGRAECKEVAGGGGGDTHGIAIDSSYDWLLDTCELVPVAQKAARVTVLERVALHFLDVGSGWVVGNDAPVTRGNC